MFETLSLKIKSSLLAIFYNFVANIEAINAVRVNTTGYAKNWQLGFQAPASPVSEGIIAFHDDLRVFLTLVFFFVVYALYTIVTEFGSKKVAAKNFETERLVHASTLEIVWTVIPAIILIIIAIPSFSLLYSVDEIVEPIVTFKVIGHQWYWSYEFLSPEAISATWEKEYGITGVWGAGALFGDRGLSGGFDSYLVGDDELAAGEGLTNHRLLTVDNHVYIPAEAPVRVLVSSADVLHCWAIPSLGIKLDACPGRLNQAALFANRAGIFYGQCSEICGVNHGFRPIGVVAFNLRNFPRGSGLSHIVEPVLAAWGALSRE